MRGFEERFRGCWSGWRRFWSELLGRLGVDLGELRENEGVGVVGSLGNVWGRLEEGFGEVEGVWRDVGIEVDLEELAGVGKAWGKRLEVLGRVGEVEEVFEA